MAQKQHNADLGNSSDCSHAPIDYANNPNLTRQEKTQMMEQALQRSLNQYGDCQDALSNNAANTAADMKNSSVNPSATAGNKGATASTASSQMSGTETAAPSNQSTDQTEAEPKKPSHAMGVTAAPKHSNKNYLAGSGRTPGDIPATDNDSVLEAQIRNAAIAETNPTIKAKLWNEYRKYKGLPAKNTSKGDATL